MVIWHIQVMCASTQGKPQLPDYCALFLTEISDCCRDVFLLSKPVTHISDFLIKTPLEFNEHGKLEKAR